MTKKQVLFSLRQVLDHAREVSEDLMNKYENGTCLHEYYSGRVDSYDRILEVLVNYD